MDNENEVVTEEQSVEASEVEETAEASVDVLDMSDSDVANLSFEEYVESAKKSEETDNTTDVDVKSEDTDDSDDAEDTEEDSTSSEESDSYQDESGESDSDDSEVASDVQDPEQGLEESASSDNSEDDSTEQKAEEESTDTIDYKAEHNKLLSPFKANGKEIQVDNVDDAITLMKMGANYNKKMQGLKPNLKLIKMLENNDLLDENKLSHLIDLSKKDPGAIKKLIKDSGIDPLDIDVKEDTEYTPKTYTVGDKEVELDEVLSDIKDSTAFKDTIDIISNKWDEPSKTMLVENPGIIKVINQHVELGIYDKISAVVEKERMLGRLNGLNDVQAYKQVGDMINAQGGFNQPAQESTSETTKTVKATTTKKPDDTKLKNRKKSASHTKSTAVKKVDDEYNPLSMSDEEFEKITSSKYM